MASFSDAAFGKDTAFDSAAFDFGSPAPAGSFGTKKHRRRMYVPIILFLLLGGITCA